MHAAFVRVRADGLSLTRAMNTHPRSRITIFNACFAFAICALRVRWEYENTIRRIRQVSFAIYICWRILCHMKVLRDYLCLTGMTQAELAKKAKIQPSALNHFING